MPRQLPPPVQATSGPVDAVVISWNTRESTLRALRELVEASPGIELRLHVHDNASSDGTVAAVTAAFPDAQVRASGHNLGFAAGVNAALAGCHAPYVLLLNSDAWPQPGALRKLLEVAQSHPNLAAVAPRVEHPDGTVELSALPFPALWLSGLIAIGAERWLPKRLAHRWLLPPAWSHDQARQVGWAHGAALLIPRTALREVGEFDERYFMYAEELDWFWRAADAGLVVRFEPAAVFVHLGGESATELFRDQLDVVQWRNAQLAFERRYGRPRALLFALLNAFGSAAHYGWARRRDNRGAPAWRALWRTQLVVLREVALRRPGAPAPEPGPPNRLVQPPENDRST